MGSPILIGTGKLGSSWDAWRIVNRPPHSLAVFGVKVCLKIFSRPTDKSLKVNRIVKCGPLLIRSQVALGGREVSMRRFVLLAVVGAMAVANAGCLIPAYSSDPNERPHELINQS